MIDWIMHHFAFPHYLKHNSCFYRWCTNRNHQSSLLPKFLVWSYTLCTNTTRHSESSWSLNHDPIYHSYRIRLIRTNTIYRDIKNHIGKTHIWNRNWFTYDASRLSRESTCFDTNCNTSYNIHLERGERLNWVSRMKIFCYQKQKRENLE